jgi:uncharacterized coiled-coil protein SlyX
MAIAAFISSSVSRTLAPHLGQRFSSGARTLDALQEGQVSIAMRMARLSQPFWYDRRMADHEGVETRVAELEARFTLQQEYLDRMSEVLWRLQRELDAVTARVATLEAHRAAAGEDAGAGSLPDDEVPPHY